jgi:hypothetical protein
MMQPTQDRLGNDSPIKVLPIALFTPRCVLFSHVRDKLLKFNRQSWPASSFTLPTPQRKP